MREGAGRRDDVDADLHAAVAVASEAAEEVARADGGGRHDVFAGAESAQFRSRYPDERNLKNVLLKRNLARLLLLLRKDPPTSSEANSHQWSLGRTVPSAVSSGTVHIIGVYVDDHKP
jgi:hypothetical protein